MTREEAIKYFKECNEKLVSVAKDENVYDYEKQVMEADCMRRTFESNEKAIKALEQAPCEDAISRKAVLEQTYSWSKDEFLRTTNPFYYLRKKIKALSPVTPKHETRWIPCSEKMPEEEKKPYWICTDYGHQCECRWTNVNPFWTDLTTDWHWHHMDVPSHQKVVAWMPLPEPYMAEREG